MFQIKKPQSSNKTVRMPDELIARLQALADQNDISFNQLVIQCCEYALQALPMMENACEEVYDTKHFSGNE